LPNNPKAYPTLLIEPSEALFSILLPTYPGIIVQILLDVILLNLLRNAADIIANPDRFCVEASDKIL
jgi:hypothetical protein